MEESELVEVLQSYKDAIEALQQKFNDFSDEISHVREEMQNKIETLENTVFNEILEPAKAASEKAAYDADLKVFTDKYSEKVSPYLDRIKAVEDEDFDFYKNTFDSWKDYEADKGDSALSEEEYVDSVLEKVKTQLETIKEAIGASEVEMKVDENGNVEATADGETIAEDKVETDEKVEDFEENLGEAGELSEEEMKKLEEEMRAEGLV